MRFLLYIPLLGILLFLVGCASMDLSMLDSAIPLKANDVQVLEYQAIGIDPFTVAGEIPDTLGLGPITRRYEATRLLLTGVQLSYGLGHGLELGTKGFFSGTGYGNKTYLKIQLYHSGDWKSLAIIPGYGIQIGDNASKPNETTLLNFNHDNFIRFNFINQSFEIPILYTIKTKAEYPILHTFIYRASYDRTSVDYWMGYLNETPGENDRHIRDLTTWRMGFFYNIDLLKWFNYFNLSVTVGYEITPINGNRINYIPIFALGCKFPGREK